MIKALSVAAALVAAPALAQTPVQPGAGGVVGGGVSAPYSPVGAILPPGTTPSGLGSAMVPVAPGLPQPMTGVTPPIGAATAGTIGDGRVGTLAPGATTNPAVDGRPGTPTTSGVSGTTPTTNPPPR